LTGRAGLNLFALYPESRIKRTLFTGHSKIFQKQPVSGCYYSERDPLLRKVPKVCIKVAPALEISEQKKAVACLLMLSAVPARDSSLFSFLPEMQRVIRSAYQHSDVYQETKQFFLCKAEEVLLGADMYFRGALSQKYIDYSALCSYFIEIL
jgi:hypothetical protein